MNSHNYCLILAGGVGQRLWPVSRSTKPKQFLDFFGTGRTMLQQTYDRVSQVVDPRNIFISTNVQYLSLIYEQLPQVDDIHILEEPLRRGTLSSVVWGMTMIMKQDPKARVLVTPSDQLILQQDVYTQEVLDCLDFVADNDCLVVMGEKATRPETRYGYIQKGEETDKTGISKVKTFTEKPALEFAETFVRDGGFLWNTGLHAFRAETLLNTVCMLMPGYQLAISRLMADAECDDAKLVPEVFRILPNLNLAVGLLERASNVYVKECSFGWADLGTWASLHDDCPADPQGNVLMDTQAYLYDCNDNVIRLPKGRIAVVKGLKDYVIAEEGEILMICPREDVATMRKMHTDTKFR